MKLSKEAIKIMTKQITYRLDAPGILRGIIDGDYQEFELLIKEYLEGISLQSKPLNDFQDQLDLKEQS